MKKYSVSLNAEVVVIAENEDEAINKARTVVVQLPHLFIYASGVNESSTSPAPYTKPEVGAPAEAENRQACDGPSQDYASKGLWYKGPE